MGYIPSIAANQTIRFMIRAVVKHGSKTFRYTLDPQSHVSDLATLLAESIQSEVAQMRLIANGRELELKESLSMLGEFWFMSNAIFLRFVDPAACRDWQKTGRCSQGRNCPHASSHTMQHSPRYVAHQQPEDDICLPCSTAASSPPSSSEHSSPYQSPRVHESPPSSPPRPEQDMHTPEGLVVCKNWRKGACKFGDRCHWASTHLPEYLPKNLVAAADDTGVPSYEEDGAQWTTSTQQTVLLSGPDASPTMPSTSMEQQQLENPNPWHSIGQYEHSNPMVPNTSYQTNSAPMGVPQYYVPQYINYNVPPYGFNQQPQPWGATGLMSEPHYGYQHTSTMVMS